MMWTRKNLRDVIQGYEYENIEIRTALECKENEINHLRAENKKLIGLLFQIAKSDERN